MENESDSTYKDLVQNEMIFIRKNREKIVANAKLLYKQKAANDTTAGYVKTALNYRALEMLCDSFCVIHLKNIKKMLAIIWQQKINKQTTG